MADDGWTSAGRRLSAGDPDHDQAAAFFTEEAWLLDDNDLQGWLALLSEDLTYRMPNRVTVGRREIGAFPGGGGHYDDDYPSIRKRVRRLLESKNVWAEDPASRTRRLVANLVCRAGAQDGEIHARTALVVTRSRMDQAAPEVISAERRDVLRRQTGGLRLLSRTVLLDHTLLSTPNLAIFL